MLLRTYAAVLADNSEQSIIEAAQRYTTGDVEGQSRTFAPSVPEFVAEVRRREEYISLRNRPRLEAPKYRPGPLAPFEVRRQQALSRYAHLPVLFEDIGYDQWRKLSAAKEVPTGAIWVAALGMVFGPVPKRQVELSAA